MSQMLDSQNSVTPSVICCRFTKAKAGTFPADLAMLTRTEVLFWATNMYESRFTLLKTEYH